MRLKSCFGCFSLQTGTVAVGSMSLVWAILSAISSFPFMMDLWNHEQDLLIKFVMKTFFTGLMIYVVVIGTMAGLMIYGAEKKNPTYVLPWLALSTTDFLAWTSITLGVIITAPMMIPLKLFLALVAFLLVFVGIHFYVSLVVFSFYRQIVIEKYRDAFPITDVENLDQLKTGYHNV